ncbi:hypothetical protein TWF481_007850 [Arthrobotrys musiformis]|uniref:Fungal N-terminal domain-containing protein n=1 Tax=Arthrobotrys musiformis TaxID=47236 RepID=A0AAV9W6H7_9PEZI
MEPLPTNGGVLNLLLSLAKLSQTINDFRDRFQSAEPEIRQLMDEANMINSLSLTLKHLDDSQGAISRDLASDLGSVLQGINATVIETEVFLTTALSKKFQGVYWGFTGKKQCAQFCRRLESYRSTLNITLTLVTVVRIKEKRLDLVVRIVLNADVVMAIHRIRSSRQEPRSRGDEILNSTHDIIQGIPRAGGGDQYVLRKYLSELETVDENSTAIGTQEDQQENPLDTGSVIPWANGAFSNGFATESLYSGPTIPWENINNAFSNHPTESLYAGPIMPRANVDITSSNEFEQTESLYSGPVVDTPWTDDGFPNRPKESLYHEPINPKTGETPSSHLVGSPHGGPTGYGMSAASSNQPTPLYSSLASIPVYHQELIPHSFAEITQDNTRPRRFSTRPRAPVDSNRVKGAADRWNINLDRPDYIHPIPPNSSRLALPPPTLTARGGHFALCANARPSKENKYPHGCIFRSVEKSPGSRQENWVGVCWPFDKKYYEEREIIHMAFYGGIGGLVTVLSRSDLKKTEICIVGWDTSITPHHPVGHIRSLSPVLMLKRERRIYNVTALSPDGRYFAFESISGISLFDIQTKSEKVGFIKGSNKKYEESLTWSQSSKKLLRFFVEGSLGSRTSILEIYDVVTGGKAIFRAKIDSLLSTYKLHLSDIDRSSLQFHFSGTDNDIHIVRPIIWGGNQPESNSLTTRSAKELSQRAFWGIIDTKRSNLSLRDTGRKGEERFRYPTFSPDCSCFLWRHSSSLLVQKHGVGGSDSGGSCHMMTRSTVGDGIKNSKFPDNTYQGYTFDFEGRFILATSLSSGGDLEIHIWESNF